MFETMKKALLKTAFQIHYQGPLERGVIGAKLHIIQVLRLQRSMYEMNVALNACCIEIKRCNKACTDMNYRKTLT